MAFRELKIGRSGLRWFRNASGVDAMDLKVFLKGGTPYAFEIEYAPHILTYVRGQYRYSVFGLDRESGSCYPTSPTLRGATRFPRDTVIHAFQKASKRLDPSIRNWVLKALWDLEALKTSLPSGQGQGRPEQPSGEGLDPGSEDQGFSVSDNEDFDARAARAYAGSDVNGDPISWLPGTELRIYQRGSGVWASARKVGNAGQITQVSPADFRRIESPEEVPELQAIEEPPEQASEDLFEIGESRPILVACPRCKSLSTGPVRSPEGFPWQCCECGFTWDAAAQLSSPAQTKRRRRLPFWNRWKHSC